MTPFVQWIAREAKRVNAGDRDDIVGDFCCDAMRDKDFPTSGTITVIRQYMNRYPWYAREAFEDARNEYRAMNTIKRAARRGVA